MVFNGVCYIIAAAFQAIALIYLIRTARRAADRRPWIALGIALWTMLLFRILSFFGTSDYQLLGQLRAVGPVVAVIVSIFLFIALYFVRVLDTTGQLNKTAAEHSRGLFERVTATSPDVLFIYDLPGKRHTFASAAIEPTLGYTAEAFTQLRLDRLVHPEDLAHVQRWLDGFSPSSTAVREIDFRVRHANGTTRWLNVRASVFQHDGNVREIVGAAQDITDKRERDQILQLNEERLRFGLDAGNIGAWDIDLVNPRIWTSAKHDEIYGHSERVVWTPKKFLEHLSTDDRIGVESRLRQAIAEEESFTLEYQIRRPDSAQRWVEVRGRVVRDAGRNPVRMFGTIADVTDAKNEQHRRESLIESERSARTEAERANRLKDEFLATLSHELRTPLNAILGWSQLLRREAESSSTSDDFEEGLTVIERNARVQARLVEDLLDMSRIISGKLRIDSVRVELFPVIEAAVDAVRPAALAKEISLHTSFESTLRPVRGDSARLQQVIWNLLSNAIKFTPKGGTVRLTTTQHDGVVNIDVTDDGKGIGPAFLPYVFDRFRQADGTTTRQHSGLGLGLAIVKNLVELHGGKVTAHSDGDGRGSTFRVELPEMIAGSSSSSSSAVLPELPHVEEPAESETSLTGISVLVVDDERDARELVSRVLTARGATVRTAGSASEAMAMLTDWHPNVLLSDIGMPEQDGYDLIRMVRQLPPSQGGTVPAAALTAFARSEDRRRVLLAGFQSHVAKPVEPEELIAVIASLSERYTVPA